MPHPINAALPDLPTPPKDPMTALAPDTRQPLAAAGFNLAEDPWIAFPNRPEMSLRDTLAEAGTLPGWPSGEPLFTSALLRLLTALAYRISRIAASDTFQTALDREALFDAETVNRYFDAHRDELWLVPPAGSDHRPFYQDPGLAGAAAAPIARSRLAMEVLPSYVWGQQHPDPMFTPAAAARALLVFLLYGPGGSGGSHPDLPRTKWQFGRLRGKVSIHPTGASLHDTLKLHLIDPADLADVLPDGIGVPSWETSPVAVTDPLASPRTIMEQLTSRWEKTALLIATDGRHTVGRAVTASGRRRGDAPEHDPYAVRWDTPPEDIEKAKGKPLPPYRYLRGSTARAPWRDIDNYRSQRTGNATPVVGSVSGRTLADATVEAWVTVSHQPDNAKDIMWAVSAIPPDALMDPAAGRRAAAFVKDAETIDKKLFAALKKFHSDAGTDLADAAKRVLMASYWSHMERLFPHAVALSHDRAAIRGAAREVYDDAVAAVGDRMSAPGRSKKMPSEMRLEPVAVTAARHRCTIDYPPQPNKPTTPKDAP